MEWLGFAHHLLKTNYARNFYPPLKKFKTWSIPLTLMVLLFIGSCKKELLTNEAPNGELLHKAQLFYNQHSNTSTGLKDIKLATTTAIAGNRQKVAKFPPLWDKATTARTATGVSVISVPLAKFKLSNNELDYERRVVFEEEDGEVTGGRITEVFAATAAIKADGSALAIGSADPKSTGFSGSIIDYDLAYKQPRGRLYKNGQQAKGEVSVLPMPKGGFKALQPLGNKRSGSAKGGQSIAMGPDNAISGFEPEFEDGEQNCDNIYLAYIEKDEYGNITFVEVLQFLYRICTGGPVGQQPPGGTSILVDCAEVVNGSAKDSPCGCIGGTTGITECSVDTVMTSNFVKNAKAMCALAKLMNNGFFKNTLNNFIGVNKPIDLTFKLENIPQSPGFITAGTTSPSPLTWNSNNIDLILAENVIQNQSSIEVAFTLLHEGIHAEIYRKLLSIHGPSNLNNMNFPSMFNLYQQYKLTQGFSHEYMANYYVNIMANALKEYDNNKFDIGYYKALSWGGLNETNYYINNLSITQKDDISLKTNQLLNNRNKEACNDL